MFSNHSILILGGARSGKSRYAEEIAKSSKKELIYIATAQALDSEMKQRITKHKEDRAQENWITIEEPIELAKILEQTSSPERVILIDCLTMWITNLLATEPHILENEINKFLTSIHKLTGTIIFVSNEVGMSVVPLGKLTRQFVDETGRLHQQLAQHVDDVILMVAGLPHKIKTNGELP